MRQAVVSAMTMKTRGTLDVDQCGNVRGVLDLFTLAVDPHMLGNHNTGVEPLGARPIVSIAKQEHRDSWLGQLLALCADYPGVTLPQTLLFFDREDQASMLRLVGEAKHAIAHDGLSLMIHVEGTRALRCRQPVERVSAVFIDLALAAELAIVPVRFAGGLPIDTADDAQRQEFPIGYASMDIFLGRPIAPRTLRALLLAERRNLLRDAINQLGPDLRVETPNPPDPAFAAGVDQWMKMVGMTAARAAVLHALELDQQTGPEALDVLARLRAAAPPPAGSAEADWLGRLLRWFSQQD